MARRGSDEVPTRDRAPSGALPGDRPGAGGQAPGLPDPQLLAEIQHLERKLAELRGRVVGAVERERLPDGPLPLVLLRIGAERVALLQSYVREVVMVPRLTPLPEAPPWVPGVLNYRGESLLVLDALARLARSARRPELSDRVVLLDYPGRRLGLLVQEVLGVATASRAELQSPSQDLELAPYLLGVLHLDERPTLLFSVGALLGTSGLPSPAP